MPKVVVGRDREDRKRFGTEGTILLGKHLVGTGEDAHLTTPVYMDVIRPHIALITGKRGSGKCLLPDTEIPLSDGSFKTIEEIFEFASDKSDTTEEEFLKCKNYVEILSVDRNLEIKPKTVSHVYRKKVDEELLKIKTRTGKEITVTKEHPLLLKKENIEWKQVDKLREGDFIALPRKTDLKIKQVPSLNPPHIKSSKFYKRRSQNEAKILKSLLSGPKYSSELNSTLGRCAWGCAQNLIEKDLIIGERNSPLKYRLTNTGREIAEELKSEKKYRNYRELPVKIPEKVNKDLVEFLAFLIAEGTEQKINQSFRFIFTNSNGNRRSHYQDLVKEIFDLEPKTYENYIYFNSAAVSKFLEENEYTFGKNSFGKTIPEFINRSTDKVVASFLKTYFDCEAYIDREKSEIELITASKDIATKISYMLLRFGIISRTKEKKKYASNTEDQIKRKYNCLYISGKQNLFLFKKFIGFGDNIKNKRLEKHVKKRSNPNLDVIPNIGKKLRDIRESLGMSRDEVHKTKQVMKAYEDGKYNPTIKFLEKVIEKYEKRLEELQNYYDGIDHADSKKLEEIVEKLPITWNQINKKLGIRACGVYPLKINKHGENVFKIIKKSLEGIVSDFHLKKEIESLKILCNSDVYWDTIEKIERVDYKGYVYDLTIPETHNFIAGRNGGIICHNSYSLGVIAEELAKLPRKMKQNIATLIIDTQGIFWTNKSPNEESLALLEKWNLEPRGFDMQVYVPKGQVDIFEKAGVLFDGSFSLKPSELTSEDWIASFDLDINDTLSILIQRAMKKLGQEYTIKDIIEAVKSENGFEKEKLSLENMFSVAKDWVIFGEGKMPSILEPGKLTVLDVSLTGWNVRSLLVSLIMKRLFFERTKARRKEELGERREVPIPWVLMDEAHNFVPAEGNPPSLSVINKVIKEGRQPGISLVMATQRPEKLHPDALSQSDLLLSHKLTTKADIDALRSIMQTYMLYDVGRYLNELPKWKGAGIIIDDNSERLYKIRVRPKQSWHAGSSPTAI